MALPTLNGLPLPPAREPEPKLDLEKIEKVRARRYTLGLEGRLEKEQLETGFEFQTEHARWWLRQWTGATRAKEMHSIVTKRLDGWPDGNGLNKFKKLWAGGVWRMQLLIETFIEINSFADIFFAPVLDALSPYAREEYLKVIEQPMCLKDVANIFQADLSKRWETKLKPLFIDHANALRLIAYNAMFFWNASVPQRKPSDITDSEWEEYRDVKRNNKFIYKKARELAWELEYRLNLFHMDFWEMHYSERKNNVDPETATSIRPMYPMSRGTRMALFMGELVSSPYAQPFLEEKDLPPEGDAEHYAAMQQVFAQSDLPPERMWLRKVQERVDKGYYGFAADCWRRLKDDLQRVFKVAMAYHSAYRAACPLQNGLYGRGNAYRFDNGVAFDPEKEYLTFHKLQDWAQLCLVTTVTGWPAATRNDMVDELNGTTTRGTTKDMTKPSQSSRCTLLAKLEDLGRPPELGQGPGEAKRTPDYSLEPLLVKAVVDLLGSEDELRVASRLIQWYPEIGVRAERPYSVGEIDLDRVTLSMLREVFLSLGIVLSAGARNRDRAADMDAARYNVPWDQEGQTPETADAIFREHALRWVQAERDRFEALTEEEKESERRERADKDDDVRNSLEVARARGQMPYPDKPYNTFVPEQDPMTKFLQVRQDGEEAMEDVQSYRTYDPFYGLDEEDEDDEDDAEYFDMFGRINFNDKMFVPG